MDLPTREIFGNVSFWSVVLFYCASLASVGVFVWGIRRRARLWRIGKPVKPVPWPTAASNVLRYVLLQKRVRGAGIPSLAHGLLFGGFIVLFVGTVLIGVEHVLASILGRQSNEPVFHKGSYFAVYEVVLDTAGLAMLIGCAMFAFRRLKRPPELAHNAGDWAILGLVAAIGMTGYVVEGLRIVREQTPMAEVSYVGHLISTLFESYEVTPSESAQLHIIVWWLHAAASLSLIAVFPYCRLMHAVAGAVRLASGIDRLGALSTVSMEEVLETGEIGASRLEHFTRRQLVELDACVSCGRCERACPAFEAGKPLSPRNVVQDLRGQLNLAGVRTAARKRDADGGLRELPCR